MGYGTYGMRDQDIFETTGRLESMGYQALEIAASEGWPTAPAALSTGARKDLAAKIRDLGFPPPVVMALLKLCASGDARRATLEEFRAICRMAHDLHWGGGPAVVTSTLGGEQPPWETGRGSIAENLVELAEVARELDVVLLPRSRTSAGPWTLRRRRSG